MTRKLLILSALLMAAMLPLQQASADVPPGLLAKEGTPSLAPMLKNVLPAVVNVVVEGKSRPQADNPLLNDPFFRRFFGIPQHRSPQKMHPEAIGSGVIVNAKKGIILTNNHVIKDADKITVKLNDNREFKAKLVGTDPASDIAVIKIKADHLTSLPIADSSKLQVGDFVVAIGNPFGLRQTVTSGIVSALGRHGLRGLSRYEDFIQTDASINPGNSGGALVNLKGQLVGINSAILSRSGGNIGIGFAIPSDLAQSVMQQILKYGKVKHAWLGVVGQNLTHDLAKAFDLDIHQGVLVAKIVPDSPADKAGIKERDVITSVDGKKVDDFSALANAIGLREPGDKVKIKLRRGKHSKTVTVKLGKRSAQQAAVSQGLFSGLDGAEFSTLSDDNPLAGKVKGVVVSKIQPGSPAARHGLREGDIITSVNRKPVNDLGDFRKLANASQKQLLLHIRRGRGAMFLLIR